MCVSSNFEALKRERQNSRKKMPYCTQEGEKISGSDPPHSGGFGASSGSSWICVAQRDAGQKQRQSPRLINWHPFFCTATSFQWNISPFLLVLRGNYLFSTSFVYLLRTLPLVSPAPSPMLLNSLLPVPNMHCLIRILNFLLEGLPSPLNKKIFHHHNCVHSKAN